MTGEMRARHLSTLRSMDVLPDGSGPRRVSEGFSASLSSLGSDSRPSRKDLESFAGEVRIRSTRLCVAETSRASLTNSFTIRKFERDSATRASRKYLDVSFQRNASETAK